MVSGGFGTEQKDGSYWRSYSAPQPRSYMFPGAEFVSLIFVLFLFLFSIYPVNSRRLPQTYISFSENLAGAKSTNAPYQIRWPCTWTGHISACRYSLMRLSNFIYGMSASIPEVRFTASSKVYMQLLICNPQ